MAREEGYSGWTNYETWSVILFINNESNECIADATRASLRDPYGDHLKEYVEEYFLTNPETEEYCSGNLFIQQMVGAAMSEVNWQEIRDALVADNGNDVATEDDEEEEDEDEDAVEDYLEGEEPHDKTDADFLEGN